MREVSVTDELRRPGFSETFTGHLHRWFGKCESFELKHILKIISEWIWERTVPKELRIPAWMSGNSGVIRDIDLHGEWVHSPAFGITIYKRPSIKYTRRVMFQIGLAMRSMALHPKAQKFTCCPTVDLNEMYSGDPRLGTRLVGYLCTFHQGSIDKLPDTVLAHLKVEV